MTEFQTDCFIWGLFIFGCMCAGFVMWCEYREETKDAAAFGEAMSDAEFIKVNKRRD